MGVGKGAYEDENRSPQVFKVGVVGVYLLKGKNELYRVLEGLERAERFKMKIYQISLNHIDYIV